jgi:Reverse transcriptase (RNA-dependent DNA polymerase)
VQATAGEGISDVLCQHFDGGRPQASVSECMLVDVVSLCWGKTYIICPFLAPMYGTKQGAHDWYANVKRILLTLGYSVSNADEAMFYIFKGDKYTIIATATDDFTIIADLTKSSNLIKKRFNQHFEIIDNGPINWLLGVKLSHDLEGKTISLSQQA